MDMTYVEARRQVDAAYGRLPGGAAINAVGLMVELGYPLEGAVERALSWVLTPG